MADESVSSETNPETQPASPPPQVATPVDDGEKARLSAELAQTKQALGEVAEMVKSGKLTLAPDSPAGAQVEEDDTALVDRKELKRREANLAQQVAGAIHQQSAAVARLSRENTVENVRGKLKNFDKYESEINGLLDKLDPHVAARADTVRNVYKVVSAQHQEEEHGEVASAAIAREHERLRARGIEIPEDDDEDITPTGRIPGAMASPVRSPVAPGGDASVGRIAARNRDVTIKPLSAEERVAAGIFGIKDAAEWRKYADKSWRPDLLGSKGRQKF